jgi:hypothetical protein
MAEGAEVEAGAVEAAEEDSAEPVMVEVEEGLAAASIRGAAPD